MLDYKIALAIVLVPGKAAAQAEVSVLVETGNNVQRAGRRWAITGRRPTRSRARQQDGKPQEHTGTRQSLSVRNEEKDKRSRENPTS